MWSLLISDLHFLNELFILLFCYLSHSLFSAPSLPPGNLMWIQEGNNVSLSWDPVKARDNESEVIGYKVGVAQKLWMWSETQCHCTFFNCFSPNCRYYCVRRDEVTAKSWGHQTQPLSWRYLRGEHTSSRCAQSVKEVKEPPALRSECSPPQVSNGLGHIHSVVFQIWGCVHMAVGSTAFAKFLFNYLYYTYLHSQLNFPPSEKEREVYQCYAIRTIGLL